MSFPQTKAYNGNQNLVRQGAVIPWTAAMLKDLDRCKKDPVYFVQTHFKIVTVDHGLIPFSLYNFQESILGTYLKTKKMIINSARQVGKTSIATAIILHHALFESNRLVALLANKEDTAKEILDRIQLAYEHLPAHIKGSVVKWNEKTIEFGNGSKIIASASSADNIRGKTCSLIYIDEMAFVRDWEAFSTSVMPTISSGKRTKIVFTSTPKGMNHFYDYCTGAQKKKNGFKYFEVPWWKVPGRDAAWKKTVLQELNNDEVKFRQEYCCEFLGSSNTLLDYEVLKRLEHEQPLHQTEDLKIYTDEKQDPDSEAVNVLVADVSHGKGLDYHAFSVFDMSRQPYRQIATFRNNTLSPLEYAEVIHRTSEMFNSYVLIELNDMGHKVAHVLWHDYENERIIRTERRGPRGQVPCLWGKKTELGVKTSKGTKSIGCSMLKSLTNRRMLEIIDKQTIDELKTFSRSDKASETYCAEDGKHDDTVMPLVLFSWLMVSDLFKSLLDIDARQALAAEAAENINSMTIPLLYVTHPNSSNDLDEIINDKEVPEGFVRMEGDDDLWTLDGDMSSAQW